LRMFLRAVRRVGAGRRDQGWRRPGGCTDIPPPGRGAAVSLWAGLGGLEVDAQPAQASATDVDSCKPQQAHAPAHAQTSAHRNAQGVQAIGQHRTPRPQDPSAKR
jgi:hypothetical protein